MKKSLNILFIVAAGSSLCLQADFTASMMQTLSQGKELANVSLRSGNIGLRSGVSFLEGGSCASQSIVGIGGGLAFGGVILDCLKYRRGDRKINSSNILATTAKTCIASLAIYNLSQPCKTRGMQSNVAAYGIGLGFSAAASLASFVANQLDKKQAARQQQAINAICDQAWLLCPGKLLHINTMGNLLILVLNEEMPNIDAILQALGAMSSSVKIESLVSQLRRKKDSVNTPQIKLEPIIVPTTPEAKTHDRTPTRRSRIQVLNEENELKSNSIPSTPETSNLESQLPENSAVHTSAFISFIGDGFNTPGSAVEGENEAQEQLAANKMVPQNLGQEFAKASPEGANEYEFFQTNPLAQQRDKSTVASGIDYFNNLPNQSTALNSIIAAEVWTKPTKAKEGSWKAGKFVKYYLAPEERVGNTEQDVITQRALARHRHTEEYGGLIIKPQGSAVKKIRR